jgi:hypothetical protein
MNAPDTSRIIRIGAAFFADSQIYIALNKEAKTSQAPSALGPRMSENTYYPTCLREILWDREQRLRRNVFTPRRAAWI